MTDRLPENLAQLYDTFGKSAIDEIFPGDSFTVDDVEFVCKYAPASTAERFFIVKPLELVDRYRELCTGEWKNATIVELGIAEGGSTALLALLAEPQKLVALDIETQSVAALTEFINGNGFRDAVRPYYGVDQSDRVYLAEIVDAEREGEPLDLVIDDASHEYGLTLSSFETLFPRLRPSGMFVIEDWNADHTFRDAFRNALREALSDTSAPDHAERLNQFRATTTKDGKGDDAVPLSRLAVELLLARASVGDAIESVTVDRFWTTVRRGPAELDPNEFRLGDLYNDYFGFLP